MSYDLVVFDPIKAPAESTAFLKWYEQQSEESLDPSELFCRELERFFAELSGEFPPMNGPYAVDDIDNPRLTDYTFGPYSIHMSFAWSQAAEARRAVIKIAKQSEVGFYDISDPGALIWYPPRPGQFSVFYCFYGNDEEVPSDLPLPLELKEVVSRLLPKFMTESDFLGIVDNNGVTVQFMYNKADNRFWMEIPLPEKRGSYGAYLLPEELHAKIEGLPSMFKISEFPELRFQSWDVQPSKRSWWKFWK